MKINANSARVGNVIEHQKNLWRICKKQHTMPGKGGAFVQLELKDIINGTKLNERFRSNEDVVIARLDEKIYQYLYDNGDSLALMDNKTFEQIEVAKEVFGEQIAYLEDGMNIVAEFYEEKIVSATIPEQVEMEVLETESTVKGQTAASSYKPAVLKNNIRVTVPPFINIGDIIVVKTTDNSYVERKKKS